MARAVLVATFVAVLLAPLSQTVGAEPCVRSRDLSRLARSGVEASGVLKLDPMVCADVSGGFRCLTMDGAPLVDVDATVLGRSTSTSAAERLIRCKSLDAPGCVFSIEVTPTFVAAEGAGRARVIKVMSRTLDARGSTCDVP